MDTNLHDLHRRVEKLLLGHSISPISEVQGATPGTDITQGATAAPGVAPYLEQLITSEAVAHSHKSLSPGSSLSSLSPPVSPYEVGPPPTYEEHIERQRRTGSTNNNNQPSAGVEGSSVNNQSNLHYELCNPPQLSENSIINRLLPSAHLPIEQMDPSLGHFMGRKCVDTSDLLSNPPLSPISETSSGVCNNLSGANTRSVSAAVSDESVAGDSGVFEASVKRSPELDEVFEMSLESAQIQIKLKWVTFWGFLYLVFFSKIQL